MEPSKDCSTWQLKIKEKNNDSIIGLQSPLVFTGDFIEIVVNSAEITKNGLSRYLYVEVKCDAHVVNT